VSIEGLLPILLRQPLTTRLVEQLEAGAALPEVPGIPEAARPYILAALATRLPGPVLYVAVDETAAQLARELFTAYAPRELELLFFPDRDALPYERLITDAPTVQQRLRTLGRLAQSVHASAPMGHGPVIFASIRAIQQSVLPPGEMLAVMQELAPGQEMDLTLLLEHLFNLGYESVAEIEEPGQVSHRGGIVDVFPPSLPRPVRIEFFGDEIDSLRTFDPETQRSLNPVPAVLIVPAREALPLRGPQAARQLRVLNTTRLRSDARQCWEEDLDALQAGQPVRDITLYLPYLHEPATLLDYLPHQALTVLDKPDQIESAAIALTEQAEEMRTRLEGEGEIPPDLRPAYRDWDTLRPQLEQRRQLRFASILSDMAGESAPSGLLPDFAPANSYGGRLRAFVHDCHALLREQGRVVIVSAQARRLTEVFGDEALLQQEAMHIAPVGRLPEPPNTHSLTIVQGQLSEGWHSRALALTVLTDTEVFGWAKRRGAARRRIITPASFLSELKVGDYVVHQEHGIGRFEGLVKLDTTGVMREYLLLQYAGTDRLYIPTDQLDRITRYIGMGETVPALSKLGGVEWTRAKQQVRENVQELARDLLRLYSVRETVEGHAYPLDSDQPWLQELEEAFPYVETPDQTRAIAEVKADMERPRPMDRLVCGDVGYGKTEVALRAAFKAVLDERQVAVLVPTTVLALQHYNTFTERLKAYPVRIELLSRFRSAKEQKQVLEDLALGKVDIVIGTHRLLQKDVVFNNLGLLIIDEEQRFGVAHKERLKQLRTEVDVLTLTATPIPRTLHMSLVNVRDMSVIETPPEERLPIRTYIREYDEALIREAILREIDRGGQVFFVHNRVQGIQVIAQRLQRLVPEASFVVAHGQMDEEMLERVMLDFSNGQYDVLVCTTIIENGLDIPNANTIIVNNAAHFGLAQLYQLRGRVGRGTHQAYAYFMYNKDTRLTPIAEKRLRAIFEATELGAGFRIAMKDLEIRGAGNLLGSEQSGFMNAVGFDLYCKLLAEAVQELQGKKAETAVLPSATVDLPVNAYIPDDYIGDRVLKMSFYHRLANLTDLAAVESLTAEMTDRFGAPPEPVQNLLALLRLKVTAMHCGFESIVARDGDIVITARRTMAPNRIALYHRFRNDVRVQLGVIRIPRRLLKADWLADLQDLLPSISTLTRAPTA
jgi:transcription-repair coupling factor (superfamily II helicase)